MAKYRKLPVVIDAIQWTGENVKEIGDFVKREERVFRPEGLFILTLEGEHFAKINDYIIKGVNGEFYPCKPDIFLKTYEPAE